MSRKYKFHNKSGLQFMNHTEGYTQYVGGNFEYVYQYKDHLGNVRLSYTDSNKDGDIDITTNPNTNELVEESNYYPFGLKHKGYNNVTSANGNSVAQKFKYNGKELEESLGYGMYEYEARHYDAALARFVTNDPLAEDYNFQSPYAYAINDPIRFIDKLGMGPETVIITGATVADADKATEELNKSTNLSITRDPKTGELDATGTVQNATDQKLLDAIRDPDITVKVDAQKDNFNSDGSFRVGGSFMGNTVNANGTVTANQEINPYVLGKMSDANGKPGADVLHEVTEAYEGALISKASGVSSPPSHTPGSVYLDADARATPQSGVITRRFFRKSKQPRALALEPKGVIIHNPLGVVPRGTHTVQYISNGVVIQEY